MQPKAIHQFSPSSAFGDGMTNGMLYTRELLRSLGFASEIYCANVARELKDRIRPYEQYRSAPDQVLLVHHCFGHDHGPWVKRLDDFKVLVYHNITPEHFFSPGSVHRHYARLGREQLGTWVGEFRGAIGVSEFNSSELRTLGYRPVETLPLLVNVERIVHAAWDPAIPARHRDTFNILFVGRINPNKCQHDLIEVLEELRHLTDLPARLFLVGGVTDPGYLEQLHARIAHYGLVAQVELPGKVGDAALHGYYRAADVFLCLSEHEGFGMPLIEAMLFDVPVLAYDSSNIANTLGDSGLLFRDKHPREIAAAIKLLSENPGLRRRLLHSQRRNVARFDRGVLRRQLHGFLTRLGLELAPLRDDPAPLAAPLRYRIEGPFDSSYSLAVLNRGLALALAGAGEDVGLVSTEGTGDFAPEPEFLRAHPDVARLWRRAHAAPRAETVLRNLYPPRVDGMRGVVNAMGAYGWEESAFPPAYVAGFNRRLDLLTVMSRYVRKVLQDNGVKVPIAVIGLGADHLSAVPPRPLGIPLNKRYRFLHVSSCFPRKGVDVLLAAYGRAFRARDDVTLVIKTFPNPHNTVAQQLAAVRAADPEYPDVVLINEDLDEGALVELYRHCHAFVAPSRGEGYGLPQAEAMLFGLPVITTGHGGQTDFCTPETAWLIDYRFARAQTHMGLHDSVWAEPDAMHLAALLREVHGATPEALHARTGRARAEILARHKWSDVATRLRDAVGVAERGPMLYPQPRIGWVSTWHCRCGIATYSEHLLSGFPRGRYTVFASRNAELTVPDDERVVRCWEAGGDDPLENLYQAVVERGVEALVVQFNFSFFRLTHLAEFLRRVKERGLPVFVILHSTAEVLRPEDPKSLGHIRAVLAHADRLLVHSVADLNRLKEFGLVENAVLFPHGASAPGVETSAPQPPTGRRVIASYGFLLPHKGTRQLIEAFAQLAPAQPDLHLLLLHALYPVPESAAEQAACRELIAASGVAGRITMVNEYLDDAAIRERLATAELIVYPYQHTQESASGAVRAGLAAGRPVAVTPLAIFEDVADVVLTLPGTSPEALARGIRDWLDRPDARTECVRRQQAWLEAHRWPILAARLDNMLVATVMSRADERIV